MYQVREFTDEDYTTIAEWWRAHKQEVVPLDFLPKLGAIVEADGIPMAAAWVVMSNSHGVCYLEWLVTNPGAGVISAPSVTKLVQYFDKVLKELNYSIMFAAVSDTRLATVAKRVVGFNETSRDMIHLVRQIS